MLDQNLITEALGHWTDLTGFDPTRKVMSISIGRSGDLDTRRMAESLQTSLDLDDTFLTTAFLLRSTTMTWCRGQQVSLLSMVLGQEDFSDKIVLARRILEIVDGDEVRPALDTFLGTVQEALAHVGYDTARVVSHDKLGEARLSALRSFVTLRHDLVSRGSREQEGTRPTIDPVIHSYHDLHTAIEAIRGRPSGISLVFVADAHEKMHGHFAFLSRNGGEIRILSDKPTYDHPFQQALFRRNPDVIFEDRAKEHRFPYGLIFRSVSTDTAGSTAVVDAARTEPFGRLARLSETEAAWAVMMFDLIRERVWDADDDGREPSGFAGDAVPVMIAGEIVAGALALPGATSIDLAPLSNEDVRFDALDADVLGKDGGRRNAWMEERYADKVDPSALNLVEREGHGVLLLQDGTAGRSLVPVESSRSLRAFDGNSFGTASEIRRDRLFVARHNLAASVQELAQKEYEERKDKVHAWYRRAILRNVEFLHKVAACGALELPRDNDHPLAREKFLNVPISKDTYRFSHVLDSGAYENVAMQAFSFGHEESIPGLLPQCHVTCGQSNVKVLYTPCTARDLAMLADVPVSKLPDVLRHWSRHTERLGNSNLTRIDPMADTTKDPWSGGQFDVVLWLSKSGIRKLQSRHGTDPSTLGPFVKVTW